MGKTSDLLEKSFFTSLAAGMIIYDAAADVARDLIDKGKMAPEQGKEFLDDLSKKVEEQRQDIQNRMEDSSKSAAKSMGLATSEDLERISDTLEQISIRLAILEARDVKKHVHPPTPET